MSLFIHTDLRMYMHIQTLTFPQVFTCHIGKYNMDVGMHAYYTYEYVKNIALLFCYLLL